MEEFPQFEEYLEKNGEIQIYKTMKTDYIHTSHKKGHSKAHSREGVHKCT
jgi:hypothetical protein